MARWHVWRASSAFAGVFAAALASSGAAWTADPVKPETERVLKPYAEFLSGTFAYGGTWFGLAENSSPDFDDDRAWNEEWLELGIELNAQARDFTLYGKLAAGGSQTLGTDSFDQTNQGKVLVENAFLGVRTNRGDGAWNLDVSLGQQDFGAGTGMLIWQGAGNGFERGAMNLVPRTAWSTAAVGKISNGRHSFQGFYLDPNELESNDTETRLAGALWRYDLSPETNFGAYYLNVLHSEQIYPEIDPANGSLSFIADGRDGLQAAQAFLRVEGQALGVPGAWLRAEAAYEWNDGLPRPSGMRAWAAYGEAGYRFAQLPLLPAFSYGFATFSGDNPDTSTYERFDPLFYGNGLDNWWFGANGSYMFLNSNVNFHRFSLQLVASEQDFLKFQYVIARANELDSPIQFGQSARPASDIDSGGLIVGVQDHHLTDEIYGEWTHVFTPAIASTLWGSAAIPGNGIRDIYPGDSDLTWLGAGLILSMKLQ